MERPLERAGAVRHHHRHRRGQRHQHRHHQPLLGLEDLPWPGSHPWNHPPARCGGLCTRGLVSHNIHFLCMQQSTVSSAVWSYPERCRPGGVHSIVTTKFVLWGPDFTWLPSSAAGMSRQGLCLVLQVFCSCPRPQQPTCRRLSSRSSFPAHSQGLEWSPEAGVAQHFKQSFRVCRRPVSARDPKQPGGAWPLRQGAERAQAHSRHPGCGC